MNNADDRLQRQLEALEKGSDPEEVTRRLAEDDRELASLVRLAAAVRLTPHPRMEKEKSMSQQKQILQNAGTRRPAEGGLWERLTRGSLRWVLAPALAIGAALILMVCAGAFGLVYWLSSPSDAQAATLMDIQGQVVILQEDGNPSWQIAQDGDHVYAGQQVRTYADSKATLVFYEGTRTSLEADTEVKLARVESDRNRSLKIVLSQNYGQVHNSVVPLRGDNSSFIMLTPSGVASVHGTDFNVAVEQGGRSRFAVNTGKVLVSNAASELFIKAGQSVVFGSETELEEPAYQFRLQGVLESAGGDTWVVSGVPFTITPDTEILGMPEPGDLVYVEGRVVEGAWVADLVDHREDGETQASFTGTLNNMNGNTWDIGGHQVVVNNRTQVDGDLALGDTVRVTFTIQANGRWQALQIEALEDEEPEEPTATPDPEARPSLSFGPDELHTSGCEADYSLTGTLSNTGSESKDVAANVVLGYQVIKGAEFVNSVSLSPEGWDTIEAGGSEDYTVQVSLDEALWQAAPAGSEVKVRVFIAQETNRPDHHKTRATVTIVSSCEVEETEEPELTETPVISETVTITPSVTVTPTETITTTATVTPTLGIVDCTGTDQHPTGLKLAQRYQATHQTTYEDIMHWFCQGFGFGEIDLAYSLSVESGVPVEEIFGMKSSGMGWGEIKQQLDARGHPGKPLKTEKPEKDKPNKPDKNKPGKPGSLEETVAPGAVQETPAPWPPGSANKPTKKPKNK